MKTLKMTVFLMLFSLVFYSAKSQEKANEKIQASAKVLTELGKMKEQFPQKLLDVTEGIIIIPEMKNAGFGVAGRRGKGLAVIRNTDGSWSNPVFITLTGGSFGFQAGIESVDLVLIFKNRETLEKIGKGSFILGGDASVTSGPVGRDAAANTDYKLDAEVYSYSKAKGLFAGISLSGSSLHVDKKTDNHFYGNDDDAKAIFKDDHQISPNETATLRQSLDGLMR